MMELHFEKTDTSELIVHVPTDILNTALVSDLVSVIVPTFNRAAMTVELLDNLADQTWHKVEVIVIDDGSTDDTVNAVCGWIAAHPERHVRLLSQANAGPAGARNRGVANARGEFIYFIDSDDLVFPSALTDMVGAIRSSGYPYCLAPVWISDFGRSPDFGNDLGKPRQLLGSIVHSGWMTHAALYRHGTVASAGQYDGALKIGEDTEFHWRIAAVNGPGHMLSESIGLRREHDFGHVSIGRTERDLCHGFVAIIDSFQKWATANGAMTRTIGSEMAESCLNAGVKLGYWGDWASKDQAFATIAGTGQYGPGWHHLAAALGRPNSRAHFAFLRLILWIAKHFRRARRRVYAFVARPNQPGSSVPPDIRTT